MRFSYLKDAAEVLSFIEGLHAPVIAIDTETTGLDPRTDKLLYIIVGDGTQAAMFDAEQAPLLHMIPTDRTLVLQNFRFDYQFLSRTGVDLPHRVRDTMLLHHLLDEEAPHGLDAQVQAKWGDRYKEEFWAKYASMDEATIEDKTAYACKDAIYTALLYDDLVLRLHRDGIPDSLVEHVHRLALALYETERDGVCVDVDYLVKTGRELYFKTRDMTKSMRQSGGLPIELMEIRLWQKEIDKRTSDRGKANVPKPDFNFNSAPQLCELLYGVMRLPVQRNQKTKSVTVDDDALETLKEHHPLIPALQEYRGAQKVFSSFIEGTLEKLYQGRIYPSLNVNGTVTGRISASNPNLQQLPREGAIRGMYVPDPGDRLLTCDYSQLEIVLAAHFSNDPVLLDLIASGRSMHDHTANSVGIARQDAKTLNFLCIYGGTEYRASIALGITVPQAKRILDKLWETYRGLKSAIDECHQLVDQGLPIVTPFGRKRRLNTLGQTKQAVERMKRQAFNALVQGTGADLTSQAFYLVSEAMREQGMGRALFPVHDEIVVSTKITCVDKAKRLLMEQMVEVGRMAKLRLPLSVECSEPLERWQK